MSEIGHILEKIEYLPPLPAAVQKLYELSSDLNSDIREMGEVILKDQALTAKILRVVNSAFYGLSQKVGTVSHAIVILGFNGVKNLALGISVINVGSGIDDCPYFTLHDFWKHSLATASVARVLSRNFKVPEPEEVFVAGLLHDIGKLVFMKYFTQNYIEVLEHANRSEKRLFNYEKQAFGIDHARLGYEVCRYWKLPLTLTRAVREHHSEFSLGQKPSHMDKVLFLTRAGNNLAKMGEIGSGGDPTIDPDFDPEGETLSLSREKMNSILVNLREEVAKAEILFNLNQS